MKYYEIEFNASWIRKPTGYDRHILLAEAPVEIGDSAYLNNGSFEENFVAIEKSIVNEKYVKVKMQGRDTKTFKYVYYETEN